MPELRAETSIEGSNLLGYDGLNIADGELSLGLDFLRKLEQKARFPFLSANIYLKKNNRPLGKEYLIKEFNGFRVGILGLTSPELLKGNTLLKEELVVKDAESRTKELLAEIRSRADIIIILSHLGKDGTTKLVKNVPGIDMAILGHKVGVAKDAELVDKTLVVHSGMKGQYLSIIELALDDKSSIIWHKARLAPLSKETPVDSIISDLVRTFEAQKRSSLRKERAQERRERELEKAGGRLHMTPEQIIEEMRKEDRLISQKEG